MMNKLRSLMGGWLSGRNTQPNKLEKTLGSYTISSEAWKKVDDFLGDLDNIIIKFARENAVYRLKVKEPYSRKWLVDEVPIELEDIEEAITKIEQAIDYFK